MRKTFATVALFAVLGTLAVSCQKESIKDSNAVVAENGVIYTISYSIDGINSQITLVGEDAWHDFLNQMLALAVTGHIVSFRNANASSIVAPTKEAVIYTTSSSVEAFDWSDKMTKQGYNVLIEYDDRTGIYTCTATR